MLRVLTQAVAQGGALHRDHAVLTLSAQRGATVRVPRMRLGGRPHP